MNKSAVVVSVALLLVALLVSNFWFTLGVIGIGYIFTVPVTCFSFTQARAKYERMQPLPQTVQG